MGQKNVNVTVVNNTLTVGNVNMDTGDNTLNFKRSPSSADWKLTDLSIWPNGGTEVTGQVQNPPFSNKDVEPGGGKISVEDNNPGGTVDVKYQFRLYGKNANGDPLQHDPEIINKKE